MSKFKIGVLFIFILLIGIGSFEILNRWNAKKIIKQGVEAHGITTIDIKVEDFSKDWKIGGYNYKVALKTEEDIYYEYHYEKKKWGITISTYSNPDEAIMQKKWGGRMIETRKMEL